MRLHPNVSFQFVGTGEEFPPADLVILPGSKSVAADLEWTRDQGWDKAIMKHLRYGGKLIGISGGFQMMGNTLYDPDAIEGTRGCTTGLGLLDMSTTLTPSKTLTNVTGRMSLDSSPVSGYEIHAGVTTGAALGNPAILLDDCTDGAVSQDGQLFGTYLHGVFETASACNALLGWAGLERAGAIDYPALREGEIDRLADTLEDCLDLDRLFALLGTHRNGLRSGA